MEHQTLGGSIPQAVRPDRQTPAKKITMSHGNDRHSLTLRDDSELL